jgi:hypothetical protein
MDLLKTIANHNGIMIQNYNSRRNPEKDYINRDDIIKILLFFNENFHFTEIPNRTDVENFERQYNDLMLQLQINREGGPRSFIGGKRRTIRRRRKKSRKSRRFR